MKPLFPAITVNGVEISAQRIANEAQNHPAPKGKPGYAYKDAARALAVRELLLQEARRRGIAPEPAEVSAGQVETEEEALIRQLLAAAVTPHISHGPLVERLDQHVFAFDCVAGLRRGIA